MPLIEKLSSQAFQGFQEDGFDSMIQSMVAWNHFSNPFSNNKYCFFLMSTKEDNTNVGAFTISFRGLFDCCSNRKGKLDFWLNLVVMILLSTYR